MRNSKGSILAITVGFTLIFTMLGTASIYISTLHRETQEKQILSHQAFWLAEAGINRSVVTVPPLPFVSQPLGDGTYTVTVTNDPLDSTIYTVRSTGWMNNSIAQEEKVKKTVEVKLKKRGLYAINSTTISSGNLTLNGHPTISCSNQTGCTNTTSYNNFTDPNFFQSIFGLTWDQMKPLVTNINPKQTPPNNETAWSNGTMTVNGWSGSGILIVNSDNSTMSGNLTMSGESSFHGIIWVQNGDFTLNGNNEIDGAIFVNGNITMDGTSAKAYYNTTSILAALGNLGWVNYSVIHWEENDNHVLPY